MIRLAACILSCFLFLSCSEKPKEPVVWKSIEKSLQTQFITVRDGDTLLLPEGNFMFTQSLLMDGKNNITIQGAGKDKTILSFKNQTDGAQGIYITHGKNIVVQDITIQDAKGDILKVSEVQNLTLRNIRAQWTGGPSNANGAYALYPVLCKNVLMEGCEAIGSSDAGIYVGQSDSVIIRNNLAYWNVAGIESENSKYVEIYGNEAYDNTGGILIFDLPGLSTYGHTTKVFKNNVHDNNHENFATPGNVVASIPPGTGMLILATHDLELTDNDIKNNTSVGVGLVSYDLVSALNDGVQQQENAIGGVQTVNNRWREDSLYYSYPYNISIHHNRYSNDNWFPSLGNDIGKLLFFKSFGSPPDVLFDGIPAPDRPDRGICIEENAEIVFIDLDAAHEFKDLSKDAAKYACKSKSALLK